MFSLKVSLHPPAATQSAKTTGPFFAFFKQLIRSENRSLISVEGPLRGRSNCRLFTERKKNAKCTQTQEIQSAVMKKREKLEVNQNKT